MASNSEALAQSSAFGRGRRRGTCNEDGGSDQNALVDSDETQPPSQPLEQTSHGSSDVMGNPTALLVLSPEGLW